MRLDIRDIDSIVKVGQLPFGARHTSDDEAGRVMLLQLSCLGTLMGQVGVGPRATTGTGTDSSGRGDGSATERGIILQGYTMLDIAEQT